MSHYSYQEGLREIWTEAVARYRSGQRGAEDFFTPGETEFLRSIGATAQEVYDFAEDFVVAGEPDYDTFAALADRRRSYFLQVQGGRTSERVVLSEDLPAKDAEVNGLAWLPRIVPKAKAKLRGEMNPDLMYGCGGDRRFLKQVDMHLAEFLALVERHLDDDQAVIDYVTARAQTLAALSG
ncbi:MAG: DUF5069 domain-containing protein [Verrucomicrobiota bacterium]